ncbi:hypothetical protein Golomagni_07870 [Golovinomyces magnicellulatus]|nr:hypothetical protein Golomagni_07870 [Golovinomyces magnicellulatus]
MADGRQWIFKTDAPGLGDIEAIWPMFFVYAWIARFKAAVTAAEEKQGKQPTIEAAEAQKIVTAAAYHDKELDVDADDFDVKAMGLKKGDTVTVGPTDFGLTRRDKGTLVGINADEVVIETKTSTGGTIRAHAPRHSFRIEKA